MLSNSLWTPDAGSHVNRNTCAAVKALLAVGSVTAVNSEYIEEYAGFVGSNVKKVLRNSSREAERTEDYKRIREGTPFHG